MEHIVGDLINIDDEDLNVVDQAFGHGTESHKEQVLVSMWNASYASLENPNVKLFTITTARLKSNTFCCKSHKGEVYFQKQNIT